MATDNSTTETPASTMSGINLDLITNAGTDEKVVEVYRLLKKYKEDHDRQEWERDVYKRCWEVAWGKKDSLWSEEEKAKMHDRGQIPIAINDVSKGIQGASAVATANKPGINVRPIGNSDLYVAELLKRGFDFVWNQNNGAEVLYDVVKECKTGSLGVIDVKFDESKGKFGKIIFVSDYPLDYYFDKKSRLASKADSHIIKAHLITREYAKENYDVTDEDLDFVTIPVDDDPGISSAGHPGEDEYARMLNAEDKDSEFDQDKGKKADVWEVEAWLIKKEKSYEVKGVHPQTGAAFNFAFDSRQEAQDSIDELSQFGVDATYKPRVTEVRKQRIIVGKKLICEETNPYGLDSDGDPVMPKLLIGHDRSYAGFFVGPTYRAIEISKSRNKRRTQTIYVISKNIDAPIMMTEGCRWVIDAKHGDTLMVPKDAPNMPSRLLPGSTSSELMAMEQRDEVALNDEFDMQEVMKGKLPPGVDSGKLVIALQDQAGTMSTPFLGVVEAAIEKTAKVIFALMLRHWPRKMWELLLDPTEDQSWQPEKNKKIDPNGDVIQPDPLEIQAKWLAALEMVCPADASKEPPINLEGLHIKIVAGSTTPTNRMAKRLDAMQMVEAGIYPPEIALDYIDDPNADKAKALLRQQKQQQMQMMVARSGNIKGSMPPQ
ncbi:MAG: hypothetical protein ACLQBQ_09615 [Smithella sp.]